jgi:hypothetical protein
MMGATTAPRMETVTLCVVQQRIVAPVVVIVLAIGAHIGDCACADVTLGTTNTRGTAGITGHVTAAVPSEAVEKATERVIRGCTALPGR